MKSWKDMHNQAQKYNAQLQQYNGKLQDDLQVSATALREAQVAPNSVPHEPDQPVKGHVCMCRHASIRATAAPQLYVRPRCSQPSMLHVCIWALAPQLRHGAASSR